MLKQKLRSARGETLTEVLAAILVCGFAIMLLVGMITTSMSINSKARGMDDEFYQALSEVETHEFAASDPLCTVKFSGPALTSVSVSGVRSYTAADANLTAYGKEVSP